MSRAVRRVGGESKRRWLPVFAESIVYWSKASSVHQRRPPHVAVFVLLLTFLSIHLTSCAGPVTIGPDRFGIGLYRTQFREANPDVTYFSVEGIGVLFAPGRVSLGYAQDELVSAKLDNRSYSVRTPLADFAVGKAAEEAAIEFVSSDNPRSMKGKRHE